MKLMNALISRRSIRQFENTPVSKNKIDEVIKAALLSPSNANVQPYRLAVATGDLRDKLQEDLSSKFIAANQIKNTKMPKKLWRAAFSKDLPDGDFNPNIKYPKELMKRKYECGYGLYDCLKIKRDAHLARDRQMQRNFEFFGAPVVVFVFCHGDLGVYSALDTGIFVQSLMLAATAQGLGTCPQAALAMWKSPIENTFIVEDGYKLICGISMGYPSKHPVNSYQPQKRNMDEVLLKLTPKPMS